MGWGWGHSQHGVWLLPSVATPQTSEEGSGPHPSCLRDTRGGGRSAIAFTGVQPGNRAARGTGTGEETECGDRTIHERGQSPEGVWKGIRDTVSTSVAAQLCGRKTPEATCIWGPSWTWKGKRPGEPASPRASAAPVEPPCKPAAKPLMVGLRHHWPAGPVGRRMSWTGDGGQQGQAGTHRMPLSCHLRQVYTVRAP